MENLRQFLLLRTDILQKTVSGYPWRLLPRPKEDNFCTSLRYTGKLSSIWSYLGRRNATKIITCSGYQNYFNRFGVRRKLVLSRCHFPLIQVETTLSGCVICLFTFECTSKSSQTVWILKYTRGPCMRRGVVSRNV